MSSEADLSEYEAQLRAVEEEIRSCADDSRRVELIHLKRDLAELVMMTKAELVAGARARLLASIEESMPAQTSYGEEVTVSMRARAPYHYAWGG